MTRREQLRPEIARLREVEGLEWKEIGARLGLARSTVFDYYSDPTGNLARARKAQYQTPCSECGKLTNPNGLRPCVRCRACSKAFVSRVARERVIEAIQDWSEEHGGIPPAATDWNPPHAITLGHPEKAEKFHEANGRWPYTSSVVPLFGTWNAAIRAAGFEPRPAGRYSRDGEDPEIIADTVRRYLGGMSAYSIAREDGLHDSTVRYRLQKAGVRLRPLKGSCVSPNGA